MVVHTVVNQSGGYITVTLQCQFTGLPSPQQDVTDKQLIAAFGDPEVDIAGNFTDPNDNAFTFQFPETENYVGITTQLLSNPARFYLALPAATTPGQPAPVQGPMDCITPNPSQAAVAWAAVVTSRISQAMLALRAKTVVPPINDVTV